MRESTPHLPDAAIRQGLLQSLRDLERDPTGADKARRHIRDWLGEPGEPACGPHPALHELRDWAARREREGAAFQVPGHLLACGACMEIFQVLRMETSGQAAPASPAGGLLAASPSAKPRAKVRRRLRRVSSWLVRGG